MKDLEFTFELFEENCKKQDVANWIDGPNSYLSDDKRSGRDRYAENFFICMRRELEEAIPQLENEIKHLKTIEASPIQTAHIQGQIDLIKAIIGVRCLEPTMNEEDR